MLKKAIIPVAGKGTRFLPATKEIPKEMIPLVDRPMIHYAVEEAVLSGIEEIIFVTSSGKNAIEDYFDRNFALEEFLKNAKKQDYLEKVKNIGEMISFYTVRQKEQLGLGHAINCASSLISNEQFGIILADDLVISKKPVLGQLAEVLNKSDARNIIGVMEVEKSEVNKYGIIDGKALDSKTYEMSKMVEKPNPEEAPTNLATPGRYILSEEIFDCLDRIPRGVGGEYQLTDAINMLAQKEKVLAHIFDGNRHDTGSVKGFLKATIAFALDRPEYKEDMLEILKEYRNV